MEIRPIRQALLLFGVPLEIASSLYPGYLTKIASVLKSLGAVGIGPIQSGSQ
jgi:hypothetical protein